MSGPRVRVYSHPRKTKSRNVIILSLILVGSICTLLTFPHALAAPIVSDDFNDNSLDTSKWDSSNLFSGFTNSNVPIAETSQRLEIGPLLQNVAGSSYRGVRTVNSYNFSDAYSFVELVQAAASNTSGDAMFTIGNDVNAYYRMYVSAGNLIGQRKIGATKTTLFTTTYNAVNHRFLRIRHDAATGNVTLDAAPGSAGVPGTWVQQFTETWNSSISTSAIIFELKGGTFQVEANAPGKVIFDNFEVANNTAPAPTVTAISPTSGTTSGGTSVTITGTGFSAGATVSLGGTSATSVMVVSATSITATTPAHAAGAVNVVVTNTDTQSGTLSNGFTYSLPETVVLSDDFNDNSLDPVKWDSTNLFSGFTNLNVPIAETSQRLEIGPLLQNVAGSSYRGVRTVSSYNFTGAYSYVELVQAPASNTAADAMFTIGNDVNAYYRMYVSAGNLIGLRKVGATKTTLFTTSYDTVNHRFLRIRHDAVTGSVVMETAPGSAGVPGTWVQRFTETWNSSISTAAIIFELKGGTSQVEANPPGTVIFDNFRVAIPGSAAEISGINVAVNCNTSVLINFRTNVPSRAFIDYGLSTSYGLSTIDDPVRFYTEHAIQLTGLSASTTYHFRITTNSSGVMQSSDQVVTTAASGGVCPTLPVQVDSRTPDMSGAVEYVVKANCTGLSNCFTNFQSAMNTAGTDNGKRFVTVDAGLNFTGSFTLPANTDQNWIVIRSSAYASLPEGRRVSPSDSSNMFRVTQNSQVNSAIVSAAGANHIRIIGMEATIDPATAADSPAGAIIHHVVNFNANVGGSAANLAKFIGIDRSYIHGLTTKNNRRGIYWEGEDNFIIDSYISEFHDINSDGQAVLSVTSKRTKILNNTLISDGENFMWGGTGLSVPGYVIGGLEFARNHLYKPCSWKENGGCGATYGGFDWKEKNLFECKTCAQVLLFGNYFGGTTDAQGGQWPDAQSKAINIKLSQDSVGPTTCELMEDIAIYKNFGKNLHAGWDVVGRTVPAQGCTNKPDRVLLRDNVFELDATTWTPEADASSGTWNATGFTLAGTEDLQVIHNTTINANPTQGGCIPNVFSDGMLLLVGDAVATKWGGFVFKDNITDYRGCGIVGGGFNGNNAINSLDGVYTGWVFTKNGIMRTGGDPGNFPTGNIWVNSYTGLFANFNNGLDGNYRVVNGSSFHNAASDGINLGADIDGVEGATANAPTGNWPSP
jgi:hypothetical protein